MNLTTISLVALKICSSMDAIYDYLLLQKIFNNFELLSKLLARVKARSREGSSAIRTIL
jgi:hypothetical protein